MQCPAVSTQQLSMRTPPHTCRKIWLVFFCLTCTDTCQGMPPGFTFRPPKIRVIGFLGCGFPQVENRWGGAGAGGVGLGFRVGGALVVTGLGAGAGAGTGLSVVGPGSGGEGGVVTSSSSSKSENTHKRTWQSVYAAQTVNFAKLYAVGLQLLYILSLIMVFVVLLKNTT